MTLVSVERWFALCVFGGDNVVVLCLKYKCCVKWNSLNPHCIHRDGFWKMVQAIMAVLITIMAKSLNAIL